MDETRWQAARLIPISGIGGQEEKERRAASALLAVLGAVKEFNRAILGSLGAPAGQVTTFCEVPFELSDRRNVRVDGLIQVQRGKRLWRLLVEVKTGTGELTQNQVESYLEVVREQGFNGLLTISNDIVPIVGHHPVKVSRKYGKVPLHHLSWTRILTHAHMVKEHQGVSDPDQAWILGELVRYLEYEGSGALAFDDMGPHWVAVRSAVRDETLRAADEGTEDVAARWDQLIQYLCLGLGARLGGEVRPVLSRKELERPEIRSAGVARELVSRGTVSAGIRIPDTVAPIQLTANLRRMTASAAIELDAPEVKRSSARLNWLLRQLRNAPGELRVDVAFHHTRATSSELLSTAQDAPKLLLRGIDNVPRSFTLTLTESVGGKRKAGQGGFVDDVSHVLDSFYHDVVQHLRPWTRPAPQLRLSAQDDEAKKDSPEHTEGVPEAEPDSISWSPPEVH